MMMRTLQLVAALTVTLTVTGWGQAAAQTNAIPPTRRPATESTTGTSAVALAKALIVSGLSLDKESDLDFGEVKGGAAPGTVILRAQGPRFAVGGVTLGHEGHSSPALFEVRGIRQAAYAITLPVSMTLMNGSHTMLADNFTSHPGHIGVLNGNGQEKFRIGATLNVGVDQAPGAYAGMFTVTVAYN